MRRNKIAGDISSTVLLLTAAYMVSKLLLRQQGGENSAALVHVMALVLICRMTEGYVYGILASVAATILINYFFMYPYSAFNFTLTGYPLTIIVTLSVSLIVCTLASQAKREQNLALQRERQARLLLEENEALAAERTAVQVEAEKEKLRGNLLRAVSHDLRTPLTGISGSCSVLLQEEYLSPEQQKELLNGIRDSAEWLIRMVENLLTITRIEGEPATLKKSEEAAEEVAAQAVLQLRGRFPQAAVELLLPDELLMVPMDPLLIQQVLLNLLENAVRHSGAPQTLHLSLRGLPDGVCFTVSDAGRGLPPGTLKALTGGSWQDLDGDRGRGAGIGLSVCQSIIAAHGGRFQAQNRPQGGAEFSFVLPYARQDEEKEV